MAQGVWTTAVFDVDSPDTIIEDVTRICRDIGFDVNETDARELASGTYMLPISFESYSSRLLFRPDDDRDEEAVLSFGKLVDPEKGVEEDYVAVRAIFDLICRIASELDAAYISLVHTEKRSMEVVPDERPIPAAVETPPKLGVYSKAVLEGFGGVEGLFDHDPWYVADLEGGHTLVIENESPWGEWRPPTDAPYIQSARYSEGDAETQAEQSDGTVLSDPFAALEPGEYGTDVCVSPDDIAAEFRNEDLELLRVYVDEDRNLRRVSDDTFVRNVVVDAPDDNQAFVKAMLADVPSEVDKTDQMVSALLNDPIPPAFVRADSPDDETVVSRVLAFDVDTNKIELLVSLGRAVAHDDEMDAGTVESALDALADLEDPKQIERYIETQLL